MERVGKCSSTGVAWNAGRPKARRRLDAAALAAGRQVREADSPLHRLYYGPAAAREGGRDGDRCSSPGHRDGELHAGWCSPGQLAKIEFKVAMPGGGWHGERSGESLAASRNIRGCRQSALDLEGAIRERQLWGRHFSRLAIRSG